MAAKLRQRRDSLRAVAGEFYAELARVVDLHATNAADLASLTYRDGGFVDVEIRSGATVPYIRRRFDPRETREVRVYLHDGDDSAIVRGDAASRIVLRVLGGNVTNTLVDCTHRRLTHLYDRGHLSGISYGPDSLQDTMFNRRLWVNDTGSLRPPSPDFASEFKLTAGLGAGSHLFGWRDEDVYTWGARVTGRIADRGAGGCAGQLAKASLSSALTERAMNAVISLICAPSRVSTSSAKGR